MKNNFNLAVVILMKGLIALAPLLMYLTKCIMLPISTFPLLYSHRRSYIVGLTNYNFICVLYTVDNNYIP